MQNRFILILGLLSFILTAKAQSITEAEVFEKLKQKYSPEAYDNALKNINRRMTP